MPSQLSISSLIQVAVSLAQAAAQGQNLNSLLVMASSAVIDVVTRMRSYTSLAAVALDFGTTTPEYLAANLWFAQSPQPTTLFIGRWAKTNTSAQLLGGSLSTASSLLATWTAITNGSFKITIDGGAQQSLVNLNFSAATNLNGIATIINGVLTGAVVAYDSVRNRFVVTSNTTGASSTISFAVAGASGTDISAMLGFTAAVGAFVANGMLAETALAATTLFDQNFGQQWYALMIPEAVNADHQAVAAYIEASTTYHFYGLTTQDSNVLNAAATTDIAYLLSQALYNRTAVQYSSTSPYAVASLLSRILTTDWNGNKTAITLMYKSEPGITAENLTSTQSDAAKAKNCNVFVFYNIGVAIIQEGKSCSGQYIDTIIGAAAFAVAIQTAGFNTLYLSTSKIPQTDQGMHILATAIEQVCTQFENNGYLAAGVWPGSPVGAVNTGDTLPKGYYVFAPPVATQSAANRQKRLSVPFQVIAKLAGAVHQVAISVTINA